MVEDKIAADKERGRLAAKRYRERHPDRVRESRRKIQSIDFKAWREHMKMNRSEAAAALGLGRNMPQKYETGVAEVPTYVALACAALAYGLPPWRRP